MRLIARPIDQWPGSLLADDDREPPRFTAYWSDTVDLLAREVEMLTRRGADPDVVVQLAVRDRDLRVDGWIRADARLTHPGVIVAFESIHGPLRYSTDQFRTGHVWRNGQGSTTVPGWQANTRAIALGLEALRKVDRYGISKDGEQYRGWNALPPAREAGAAPMTVDEAARLLCDATSDTIGEDPDDVSGVASVAVSLWREAAKTHHPDTGGDPAVFRRLTEAKDLLVASR